jgi:TOMM system kinase/cyclase fusion protein
MPQLGELFQDRYELLSVLGGGGFGVVYKGRQLSTGQEVAVKLIRFPVGRGSQREQEQRNLRFVREMRLCARLNHPHVVKLLDSGQTPNGELFTVFEFVPGRDLEEQGALPIPEAVRVMGQVLDGLAAAHNQGVVHRDLKPANIMITSTGVQRNATILDFGIGAFVSQVAEQEQARITDTGQMLGTPRYAPPEQLRGVAPTTRSDLYSWGLVLLECLSGRPAVPGSSLPEIVSQQIAFTPVPLPPMLQGHPLGELLSRVLVKDVSKRDVTAEGVLHWLLSIDLASLKQVSASREGAELTFTEQALYVRGGPEELARPSGERRQLTVMCCSLSVAGLEGQEAELEEFDKGLRWLQGQCEAAAGRFGGYLANLASDRVLLYFGYPTAHEDDARRAARAAAWLAGQVRARADEASIAATAAPQVRVGIHTGLVIAREAGEEAGALDVVGPTTSIASQLALAAEADMVLVSETTRVLLGSEVAVHPAGEHQMHGAGRAVAAFSLDLDVTSQRPSLTPWSTADRTPFVGRDHEMALLKERWDRCCQGSGQAILLTGEPGIGKSRLARELASAASKDGAACLEGRCAEYSRQSPLRPIIDMVERRVGLGREQSDAERASRLSQFLERHELGPSEAMVVLGALLGVAVQGAESLARYVPDKRRELTFETLLSLFLEQTERRPVLLLLDDLQWADASTLELVSQLADAAPGARLCLLMTARPEFSPPWPATRVWSLQLGRLGREQVESMVCSLAVGRKLPQERQDDIFRRTDGVCLFVEELVRMLLASRALEQDEDAAAPAKPTSEPPIPATLRGLLVSRLDAVGEAKRTAQVAAAIGPDFPYELLEAVSPLGEVALRRDLQALVDAELVRMQRRRMRTSYSFKHVLFRDAAYESLLSRDRQRVHARIAKGIEQQLPELAETRPDLLALHHASAGNTARALECAVQASRAALQRSAYAEALHLGTLALDWVNAIPDEKARSEAELGLGAILTPALMATRGFGDATVKARAERTLQLAAQLGASPAAAPALGALSTYYMVLADRPRCREVAERLLSLADETQDQGLRVAALPSLGASTLDEGRFAEARQLMQQAIELHDAEAHADHAMQYGLDSLAYAQMVLGLSLCHLGYPEQGLGEAQAAEQRGEQLKHSSSTVLAILYQAIIGALLDDPETTAPIAARAGAVAAQNALRFHVGYGSILHAWATGDLATLSQGVGMLEAMGTELALPFYQSLWASLEAKAGRPELALEITERSISRMRETGNLSFLAGALAAQGRYLCQLDRLEAAEAAMREGIEVAQSQGAKLQQLKAVLALGELLKRSMRAQEASGMLEPLLGSFTEGFDRPDLKRARALLEQLQARGG